MTQLAHRTSFNLTNTLTCEVEVFANFFERARLTLAVEAETQFQDFAFALVERCEQSLNFFRQQRSGSFFERLHC